MNKSESIKAITAALIRVQSAIKPVERDGNNPDFNHKFASLTAIWETIRPILSGNGLAVTQLITTLAGSTGLETVLLHESGEWISGEMPILLAREDPQGQGSAITYARRYALAALLGVVQEDDDARRATRNYRHDRGRDTSEIPF